LTSSALNINTSNTQTTNIGNTTGSLILNGLTTLQGVTTLVSSLNVSGNTTLQGATTLVSSLNVSGNTTINGVLNWTQASPYIGIYKETVKTGLGSGTSINFSTIPANIKRINIIFQDIGLDTNDTILVQLGTSTGIDATSYVSYSSYNRVPSNNLNSITGGVNKYTSGFGIFWNNNTGKITGTMTLTNLTNNTWIATHTLGGSFTFTVDYYGTINGGGSKVLGGVLNQLRITSDGTGNFDSGQVNITYEL
jgi:hypothetical protein